MTDKNVPDLVVLEQSVVNWKDRAARIAKDDFHAFILKRFQQEFSPRHHCRSGLFILLFTCHRCGFRHVTSPVKLTACRHCKDARPSGKTLYFIWQ